MKTSRYYGTAVERWAGVGPYYAMFPSAFSDYVVDRYSKPGDLVMDPFAGRGTATFSAASRGRLSVGVEINPVGWVYARTKLAPATRWRVERRLAELGSISSAFKEEARSLPEFFHWCFNPAVRRFLAAARGSLDWRTSVVDRTLMAFLLVYLHGNRDAALSNQLRQTKAMSPGYAIRWWQRRRLSPPNIDPVAFLEKRVAWRYAKGVPDVAASRVYMGDCLSVLPRLRASVAAGHLKRVSLVLTSPPYWHLANYHYDQWLRLWLLGGAPNARRLGQRHRGKFENRDEYRSLLLAAFAACKPLLRRQGVVYVRTSTRLETYSATVDALRAAFPQHSLVKRLRPFRRPTQTRLFGDSAPKAAEVDLLVLPAQVQGLHRSRH